MVNYSHQPDAKLSHGTHGLLFIVDATIHDVEIKRLNVVDGDLLMPKRFVGKDFNNNVQLLIELIVKEKPQKIIFDKVGISRGFYDLFLTKLEHMSETYGINVDPFGNVSFNYLNPSTYNITINMNSDKDANEIAEELMKQIKKGNLNLGNGSI